MKRARRYSTRSLRGLNEVLAVMRARPRLPPELDVNAIAARFGFTVNQIWEKGRSRPLGGVRAYLLIIARDPDAVLGLLRAVGGKRKARAA